MNSKPPYSELEQRVKEMKNDLSRLAHFSDASDVCEERYRLVLDATNEGVWDWNAQTGEVYFSPRYCAMLGYRTDELPAQYETWVNLLHPDDRENSTRTVMEHLQGKKDNFELEFRLKTKSGHWKWILGRGKVIQRGSGGKPYRVIGTHLDISKRKKIEEELKLTHSIIDQASFACFWINSDSRITYANNRACRLLGYAREELLGMSIQDIDPGFSEKIWCDYWQQLQKNQIQVFESVHQRRDGTRFPVEITANYVEFNNKRYSCAYVNDLTKRKQAEEARKVSEQRLRQAVRVSKIGIFDHDHLKNTIYLSPRQREILGWGPNGPISLQDYIDLVHPDDVDWVKAAVRKSHDPAGDGSWNVQHRIIRRDGSVRWLSARSQTFFEGTGQARRPARTVGAVTDITESKHAEKALRLSEERHKALYETMRRYEHIISSTDDMMSFVDRNYIYLAVNNAYLKAHNKKRGDIVGHSVKEILGEEIFNSQAKKNLDRALGGEAVQFQAWFQFAGIGRRHMDVVYHPFADDRGNISGAVICLHDLTARRQAEQALSNSEKRFRELVEMLPVGVFETGANLKLKFANRQALEMFGYSAQDLAEGLNGFDFIAPEDRDRAATEFIHRQQGAPPGNIEYRALKKDGSQFPILFHATTIIKEGQFSGIRGVIVDIVERKRVEQEKFRIEKQYQQSQKMESIGRLAGGVAHDLNNLLSPILGYGEMLQEELSPNDKRRDSVEKILYAGIRARDLVRQLLAFSRKQTLEYIPVNLNKAVTDFIKLLHHTIREDIEIKSILSMDIGLVKADIGQIEQVIMNLAVNAQDAMPHGGCMTIETAPAELDESYAETHQSVNPGDYVMLAISDTGSGIDDDIRKHLFEPFFTTKGKQGTGLGLATVYGIVKQHGGNIYVYSERDKGTTFKIYLPISAKLKIETDIEKVKVNDLRGSETILIVEDDQIVRDLAQIILKRHGYKIISAESGPQALECLASHAASVDMLLTDVVMPDMNGRELFKRVSEIYPNMKVLYMSGYTDNVIVHRGILEEGIFFLQKPFSAQLLTTKVREVLERQ